MELNYLFLSNEKAQRTLKRLCSEPMDGALSFSLSKLVKHLERNEKDLVTKYHALVEKYADRDENGKPKETEKKDVVIKKEALNEWLEEINKLQATTFEIPKLKKIHVQELLEAGVKLAPLEWELLSPILEGLED